MAKQNAVKKVAAKLNGGETTESLMAQIAELRAMVAAGAKSRPIGRQPDTGGSEDAEFEVRASTQRAENVDIIFSEKPGPDLRTELKAAGFRYAPFNKCWYGRATSLPERYLDVPKRSTKK